MQLFRGHAGAVILVTGLIFFLGTIIDFVTLWVLQQGSGTEWQFVAATQTVEGTPRLILGLGLLYLGLHLRRSASVAAYRSLGATLLVVGILAAAVGGLLATSFLALDGAVAPGARGAFRSTALKAAILSALYVVTLVPLGWVGLRAPTRQAR